MTSESKNFGINQPKIKETMDKLINLTQEMSTKKSLNMRCRSADQNNLRAYQSQMDRDKGDLVYRVYVPEDKVSWSVDWSEYNPNEYTAKKILEQPFYADNQDPTLRIKWNDIDMNSQVDRRSHMGAYRLENGRPINPAGRTGIRGRGQLGKWGVNHAADPVVTRWLRDENGKKVLDAVSKKHILQFVSIQRLDTSEWAIPGGMCDPGENVSVTLKREFIEEATDGLGENAAKRDQIEKHLDELFSGGDEIYKGYVDDPRNTDNSWMETIVYNFHDEDDKVFGSFKLAAGDDAGQVTWMTINKNLELYASHRDFIELVVKKHNANW